MTDEFDQEAVKDALRKIKGNRTEVAKRLGVSYATATNYVNGYRMPPYETVVRIARIADVDMETLYTDYDREAE